MYLCCCLLLCFFASIEALPSNNRKWVFNLTVEHDDPVTIVGINTTCWNMGDFKKPVTVKPGSSVQLNSTEDQSSSKCSGSSVKHELLFKATVKGKNIANVSFSDYNRQCRVTIYNPAHKPRVLHYDCDNIVRVRLFDKSGKNLLTDPVQHQLVAKDEQKVQFKGSRKIRMSGAVKMEGKFDIRDKSGNILSVDSAQHQQGQGGIAFEGDLVMDGNLDIAE